jgi:hypothetical protein
VSLSEGHPISVSLIAVPLIGVSLIDVYCNGAGFVDNTNRGAGTAPRNRTGRECLIVCLWGYATYLTVHSTLAHLDRGGIHPTTVSLICVPLL